MQQQEPRAAPSASCFGQRSSRAGWIPRPATLITAAIAAWPGALASTAVSAEHTGTTVGMAILTSDEPQIDAQTLRGHHIISVLARDGSINQHIVGIYLPDLRAFLVPAAAIRDAGGALANTPHNEEPAPLELVALHDDTDVAVLRFIHDSDEPDTIEGGSLAKRQPEPGAELVLIYRDVNGTVVGSPVTLVSHDSRMEVAAATGRLPRGSHGTWVKLASITRPPDSAGPVINPQTGELVAMVSTPLVATDGSAWYARPVSDIAVSLNNAAPGDLGWEGVRRGSQNNPANQPATIAQPPAPRTVRFTSIIQQSRSFASRVMCNRCNGTGEHRNETCSLCGGRCVHNDQRRFNEYLDRFIRDTADSEPWSQQRGPNVVTVVDNIRSAFKSCRVARDRTINQRADKCLAAPNACPESPVWFIAFADGTEVSPDGSLIVLGQVLHSGHRVAMVNMQYSDPKVDDLFFGAGMIDGLYAMNRRPVIRIRNGFAVQLSFEADQCDPPIRRVDYRPR